MILGKDRGLPSLKHEPNVPPRRAGGRSRTAASTGVSPWDVWVLQRVFEISEAVGRGRQGGEAGARRGALAVQGLGSALDMKAADGRYEKKFGVVSGRECGRWAGAAWGGAHSRAERDTVLPNRKGLQGAACDRRPSTWLTGRATCARFRAGSRLFPLRCVLLTATSPDLHAHAEKREVWPISQTPSPAPRRKAGVTSCAVTVPVAEETRVSEKSRGKVPWRDPGRSRARPRSPGEGGSPTPDSQLCSSPW